MNRRQRAAEEHSARVAEKRSNAVEMAIKEAASPEHALQRLEMLSGLAEFWSYNVNSPNNRVRLIDKWHGYKGTAA